MASSWHSARSLCCRVGRAQVPLPPAAFLQATTEGEATLARLALQYLGKAKHVADLFCGIGLSRFGSPKQDA